MTGVGVRRERECISGQDRLRAGQGRVCVLDPEGSGCQDRVCVSDIVILCLNSCLTQAQDWTSVQHDFGLAATACCPPAGPERLIALFYSSIHKKKQKTKTRQSISSPVQVFDFGMMKKKKNHKSTHIANREGLEEVHMQTFVGK